MNIVPNDILSVVKLFEKANDAHLHGSNMSIHIYKHITKQKHIEISMK
jgi:hypothetical protein